MSKIAILVSILLSTYSGSSRIKVIEYISQYANIAQSEQKRTGIPASVKLAQAILEGGFGASYLAKHKNNHFGIKYRWRKLYKNYRVYYTVLESYQDHSNYLVERCPHLFRYGKDWIKWCDTLGRCNYAHGSSNYGGKLKKIIKDYKLYKLD